MHHTSDPSKVTQNEALASLIPTMYRLVAQNEYIGVNTTFTSSYVKLG
jgi:hypothetical protein